MTQTCDFLVIGAGIAGASAGYQLAAHGRVVVLEREDRPGYHATGRSAALFTESYGNRVIRGLARASWPFLADPPDGFATHPLATPRGLLLFARADQGAALTALFDEVRETASDVRLLDAAAVGELHTGFRDGYIDAAIHEPGARDLDVAALHQGFLRGLGARGGTIGTDAEVTALEHNPHGWRATTPAGDYTAPVVVNAAGAWADQIAELAGAVPAGLEPRRRTVITFAAPPDLASANWPTAVDVDEAFYFKPDAGQILASPADETPSAPCDAQPEELDIALAVDRLERATRLTVGRIASKWAGLRTFAADRTPVVGFDDGVPGFFWLAGQGGYGIKTSPALGRVAASLITTGALPADVVEYGVAAADLAPARCRAT